MDNAVCRDREAARAAATMGWNAKDEAWAVGKVAVVAAQGGACAGGAISCPANVKRLRGKRIRLLRNVPSNNRQKE